jgi:hypothetical protein
MAVANWRWYFALVPVDAARNDFAGFGDVGFEYVQIFVIDLNGFLSG